ncbi:MAG: cysteine desulfurase [Candidatus Omnitrophica bacterium CG11_big_fil_rev_8_21_14_0_20_63_9]|nr:MAG: cysteine desulfurase [Candidatus Omnitrophica bacterium CG11_big_fil_rev_8_21_14_0_20_63_9]
MFDVKRIRADFPILNRKVHDKPLVYLDNAATTQKPRQVIDALVNYYSRYNANIHRGIHALAEEATMAYEHVREETAQFIHAPSSRSIVFTRNTTESINLFANAWGRSNLKPGDQILLSEMEHHSNLVPWQLIAKATGATLAFVPVTDEGRLELGALDRLLTPRTKLVAITHMSNVLGTINPIADIAQAAHRVGALMLVDGAQSVPHLPVDVQRLDCDVLAFSSHKMLGPTGVGVLYAREELLESMDPFLGGGEMISDVQLTASTWNEIPWKFEAGTPNIADVIAFGEALAYLHRAGMSAINAHERELTGYLLKRLSEVDGVTLYGPRQLSERGGAVSFNLNGLHPHDVGTVLDAEGVAVRAGHHCAKPLMRHLEVAATVRASVYLYNTTEEIDRLIEAIRATQAFFARSAHAKV